MLSPHGLVLCVLNITGEDTISLALSLHTFDSGGALLYPRVHEEDQTGTITRRPYRSMLAPMYDIVPRYPSRAMMTITCIKRQDIIGHSCLCRSQDYVQTRQKVGWSDTVG